MNWAEAELNLKENIKINDHLDSDGHYKIVVKTPPYICKNYLDEGFRIRVGNKNYIDIPLIMLKNVFKGAAQNNGKYSRNIFNNLYPTELKNKPCYVHTIGKLFVYAGVMNIINRRNYLIS